MITNNYVLSQMMIKTPTSSAATHCMLPQFPDPNDMSLTILPEVSGTFILTININWNHHVLVSEGR